MLYFENDYCEGAHPAILQKLTETNFEKVSGYGTDPYCASALQLGTEYLFPEIGVRLWRERAFHLKLLKDPLYMEEMQAVLEDEYQYQYFQMVTVMG